MSLRSRYQGFSIGGDGGDETVSIHGKHGIVRTKKVGTGLLMAVC